MKESGHLKQTSLKDGEIRWLIDVISFAVGTGFRLSEVCNLRWSDVDLTHGFVKAANSVFGRTKSGNDRSIPFGEDVRVLLEDGLERKTGEGDDFVFLGTEGGRLDPVYVSKRFKMYILLARLPDKIHFHSLRHTYGSWLAMEGVSIFKIKELMGHADVSTTQVYAHLHPESLKEVVYQVFGPS